MNQSSISLPVSDSQVDISLPLNANGLSNDLGKTLTNLGLEVSDDVNYSKYFRFNSDGSIDILEASIFSKDRVSKDTHFFIDFPASMKLGQVMKFNDEVYDPSAYGVGGEEVVVVAAVTVAALSVTLIIVIALSSAVGVAGISIFTVLFVKKIRVNNNEHFQSLADIPSLEPSVNIMEQREGTESNQCGDVQSGSFSQIL